MSKQMMQTVLLRLKWAENLEKPLYPSIEPNGKVSLWTLPNVVFANKYLM
jgi:hypothetical protein